LATALEGMMFVAIATFVILWSVPANANLNPVLAYGTRLRLFSVNRLDD
jgi:hypothetical protein